MKVVSVRLKGVGQVANYKAPDDVSVNDHVVVEVDRGVEYGEIVNIRQGCSSPKCTEKTVNLKSIIRKFSVEDFKKIKLDKVEAKEAMKLCSRKMREHRLSMKLVDAEYSFDKKKIIFYFTSEGRVDFRELVKELAKIFKIRIEMRQIGVRDEARLFGGIGPCGQDLCCCRFLKNFEPVSMKMAKLQRLPLSSGKISGICGRLMCCLFYEYKTYKDFSKGLPKEGQMIDSPQGKGRVVLVNVLKRVVCIELEDRRIEKISFNKDE